MSNQKKKPCCNMASPKMVPTGSKNKSHFNKVEPLPQEQIDELLALLPHRANQARRFVQFLGANPFATTDKCNKHVLSVNLSDLAVKYNPKLTAAGVQIRCQLPNRVIKNRLGEPTMIHEWFLGNILALNGEVQS